MPQAFKAVEVVRSSRIAPEAALSQLSDATVKAVSATFRGRGWKTFTPVVTEEELDGKPVTVATVRFGRQNERDRGFAETTAAQYEEILRKLGSALRNRGWKLKAAADEPEELTAGQQTESAVPDFAGAEAIDIDSDWKQYFDHIYDRDDQIREVIASIKTAKDTNMQIRNHVNLYGPPGCGKSEVGIALERMLGSAVLKLDATNTTKAGAENLILDCEPIPPVLIIEELEKCNEANLPWLLGIMDDRAEIVKTNARIGSIRKKAPMLVICTVNNMKKFSEFHEGALANRFSVPLYFPMPTRKLLERILLREVQKIPDGNPAWIEPALDFALNVEKTYQARRIKAIMTNARDSLLDGSYQKSRIRMLTAEVDDREELKKYGESI